MPSGSRSGGHFGGGSRSFSGGHFGGSSRSFSRTRSGGHFAGRSSNGTRSHVPSMRWRPHTTVVFGRPVYFGAARAKATSLLSVLIYIAALAAFFMGLAWWQAESDLNVILDDFAYYQEMAEFAYNNPEYQLTGTVTGHEQYGDKYCIFYEAANGVIEGYSFYVYDFADIAGKYDIGNDFELASNAKGVVASADTVPLDFKDAKLTDDAEYVEYLALRNDWRMRTLIAAGVAGALIVISLLVSATAKKATQEQIDETERAKAGVQNTNSVAQSGAWHCAYCGGLNESNKMSCDGCGADRQK